MELDWAADLRAQPGMERVMTAGALVVGFWSLVMAGRLLLWVIRRVVAVGW